MYGSFVGRQPDRRGDDSWRTRTSLCEPRKKLLRPVVFVRQSLDGDDQLLREKTYTYDALGQLTKITRPDPDTGDSIEATTEYTYDRLGRVVAETDALDRVTTYEYDDLDRLTKVVKPSPTSNPADAPDIEYGYDLVGQRTSVTDPLDRVTSYTYDALGRLSTVTQPDPDGAGSLPAPVTTYAYDGEGRTLSVLAPGTREPLTQFEYDRLGRLIKRTDPDPDKNADVSNGPLTSPIVLYGYDLAGNLTEISGPDGDVAYDYDALGRLIGEARTNPGGGFGSDFFYEYDALDRRTAVTNDVGTTNYAYDALGRLTQEELPDPDGTGPNGRPTKVYTYDAVGNLLSLTDPNGNVHAYAYDELNRLEVATDPRNEQTFYEYDYVGNLTKKTDRRGLVTEYTYDSLDRRTAEIWKDGATTVNQIDYAYDKADQLTSASDEWSAYAYTYDDLGRVKTVDNDGTFDVPQVVLTNSYNAGLNRNKVSAEIEGVEDFETTYGYDTLGRVTRVQQTGQTGGNAVQDKVVLFAYDTAGRVASIVRRESLNASREVATSNYVYDTNGKVSDLTHSSPSAQIVAYAWDYDSAGRLIAEYNTKDGGVAYDYDDTNQLIEADYSSNQTDEAYTYDESGNRVGTGISTGAGNRLLSDGTYDYEYDDEGNRTKRTHIVSGDYIVYTWDHRNRLTEVAEYNASHGLTYRTKVCYDVFDRRIAKNVDNDGDGAFEFGYRYVYDSQSKVEANGHAVDDVVLIFNANESSTAPIRRYLHGPGVDQILAEENVSATTGQTTEVYWALSDHLGTIRDRVVYNDVTGLVRWTSHFVFDSFGNLVSEVDPVTGAVITNARSLDHQAGPILSFTGREWDTDLGLYYYRARWYDPGTGQFVSEDPIFDDTTNTYRYVGNGPTNGRDPSGLQESDLPIYGGAIENLPLSDEELEDWQEKRGFDGMLTDSFAYFGDYLTKGELEARARQDERTRNFLEREARYEEFPQLRPKIGMCPDPSLVPKNPGTWAKWVQAAKSLFRNPWARREVIKRAPVIVDEVVESADDAVKSIEVPGSVNKPGAPSNPTIPGTPGPQIVSRLPGFDLTQFNKHVAAITNDRLADVRDLIGKSRDEMAELLGDGWECGAYGKKGSGWKFIQKAHPDNIIYYHEGGTHGTYYGINTGKFGRVKFPGTGYRYTDDDRATIIKF